MRPLLTPLGLFAFALLVRLLPWPTIVESGRVVFFGMDSWYHMRRVQLALANGGWPPAFDPYVNHPHGAWIIWPGLFDAFLALLVRPVHALASWFAVEVTAALVPPILGASCVVLLYGLARRLFEPRTALVAGLVLSVLPAHFWYSQIGFVDHHVAVALLATALLAAGIGALEGATRARSLAVGVLSGASLLLWPGMVLHVGLLELALLVAVAAGAQPVPRARALAVSNAVALAVVLPAGLHPMPGWSPFSPAVVSHFQPWLFAAGLLLAASWALWLARSREPRPLVRAAQGLALGLAILGASLVLFPELQGGATEAWRWLTKDEIFQGLVKESKPLFIAEDGFDTGNAELRLTRLLYLLPVLLVALGLHARGRANGPQLLFLVAWTSALAVLTLLQRRFFNSLSPAFALVLAWGGVALWRSRPAALRAGVGGAAAAAVALAVVLAGAWPSLSAYRLPIQNGWDWISGAPMHGSKPELARRGLIDVSDWLRRSTPPTAAPLDPDARPEYGVLAPWGYGHLIKYVAQRPTVVGNFGDDVGEANLRRVTAYFASREPDAVRILDDLRARYVLVQTLGDVPPERLAGDAMRKRLSVDDSPGLAHHRLLYESPLSGDRAATGRSEFRVFERVAGARLVGNAPPGATVTASVEYESSRGRRGLYRTSATADARGRYELRLAYPSRGGPPGVAPLGPYLVRAGGVSARVIVEEAAVRSGDAVTGPGFP